MRKWVWRVLLTVAVMAALTVGASAVEVIDGNVKYETDSGTVVGPAKNGITSADIKSEIMVNGTPVLIRNIAPNAFQNCSTLTSVTIPNGIITIGSHAFAASGLRTVTIPGSVSTINPNTFESCKNLSEVTLSENVTSIGTNAFNGCSGLEKIHFPESMANIDGFAFAACTKLKSIALPEGLKTIKAGTFSGCSNLVSVYIPSSVATTEVNAFSGCSKLKILHYGGTDKAALTQNDTTAKEVHLVLPVTTTTKQPECKTGGEGRRTTSITCENCKGQVVYSEERVIERLPHKEEPIPEVPADCTHTGSSGGVKCSVCDEILVKPTVTPKAPHTEVDIAPVTPTCTADGSTGGKECSVCHEILVEPTVLPMLDHTTDDAHKDTTGTVTKEPTCTEKGERTFMDTCITCNQAVIKRVEEIDPTPHDYTKKQTKPYVFREGTCQYSGISVLHYICDKCGAMEECADCDAIKEAVKNGAALTADQRTHLETKHGEITETETLTHTPKEKVEDPDKSVHGGCLNDTKIVYKETVCTECGDPVTPPDEIIKAPGHDMKDVGEEIIKPATCQEEGLKKVAKKVCSRCQAEENGGVVPIPKTNHKWVNPVEVEKDKDGNAVVNTKATCGADGVSHVIVTCENCKTEDYQVITLPATGVHAWGDWKLSADGKTEIRTCTTCGAEDKRPVSPTEDPDKPDDPSDPDKPTTKPEDTIFKINLVQASNGTFSASKSTAKKGETVTVTYTPDSGYVLDMIRVISSSSVVSYTDLGGGRFQFTMPASDVEVRVTFDRADADYSGNWGTGFGNDDSSGGRSDPRRTTDIVPGQIEGHSVARADAYEQIFQDVPTGHWAAGEINWASGMGYMSGSGGRFTPDGLITHQQMWMVLARLTGASPANMAEARSWAVRGGYADGSSPTGAVKRHQLVTALYRCAGLTDGVSRANVTLSGYPDSRAVPTRARVPFAWALTSGVVNADANGLLNPAKNVTRAEFAAILYCYSQRF